VLLGGEPAQLAEKLPQVSNLNAFPTTLFVGRDGKLKSTRRLDARLALTK
jgi:hypothetical protein